ncbi:hypothetical protein DL93DRAFT_2159146 [Clavulina sp. PMI_390]|nr:hypothetical protein DL93DRAFT_2159146 [Clavulina sp. PMI_390]
MDTSDPSSQLTVVRASLPSPPSSPAGPRRRRGRKRTSNPPPQSDPTNESEPVSLTAQSSDPSRPSPKPSTSTVKRHTARPPLPPPPAPPPDNAQYLAERINNVLGSLLLTVADTLKGVLSVLSFAFVLLQKPIAFILIIYCLLWLTSRFLVHVESALAPICTTPIISGLLPFCAHLDAFKNVNAPLADYSQLLALQSRLESVVEMQGDLSLTQRVRKTEVAMRDLTAHLRVSELASKDALVRKLESFTADAHDATRGLQRFSSRVGGSLDTIIAMDDFALKHLEKIEKGQITSGSRIYDMILFRSPESVRIRQRQELASTFEQASEVTAEQLERLVTEAEVVLMILNRLDDTQNTLHEMILAENKVIKREGGELLAQLWTILGGNRAGVALFKEHRELLAQMSRYRDTARDRVQATIDQLRKLSEDLSELRDRVVQPVLIGADGVIPLEVHLDGLRRGVEKLEAFRNQDLKRGGEQLRQMLIEPLPESQQIGSA